MTDYSELKRLAEAATPGRVHDRLDSCGGGLKYECFGDDGSLVLKVDHKNDEWGFIGDRGAEDEAFFLACTPAVVLGLIAANEKLADDYDKAWRHHLNDKNNIEAMVGELAGAQAMLETAYSERDQLKAEVDALRKSLLEASEEVATWGAYSSEYFQEKHDLAGCVARLHDAAMSKEAGHD